jgi:hypothetical protein
MGLLVNLYKTLLSFIKSLGLRENDTWRKTYEVLKTS